MSFFIFSSESHRRFVLWLLALVVLPVTGLFALGVYLQPLFGDLTRIGFYSERAYGWNDPQMVFSGTQLEFNVSPGNSSRYYELVVLGDSFSRARPEFQWQNYLAAATGVSIGTMDINKIRLDQILASPGYREHPPKVLIMESVERELPSHLEQNIKTCGEVSLDSRKIDAIPVTAQVRFIFRDWENYLGDVRQLGREKKWSEINPGYMSKYLLHHLFVDVDHPEVYRMDLARPAPFSSSNKRDILVYHDDLKKIQWWEDVGLSGMGCRIEAIRRQVEANGYTRFVLMVPPDKLTAYSDFLGNPKFQHVSRLSTLANLYPDVMPRLDNALSKAIHAGEQDVYLPDDTHWGSNGQRIAAKTLVTFLIHPQVAQ